MPIHIDFFHPARLAIIVVRGEVTGEDISEAIGQMLTSGAMHYRKLIDISSPSSPMSDEDVRQGINDGTYKSPHLKLLNLSPEARVAFETAGFDMFIETFKDMKTAVASF